MQDSYVRRYVDIHIKETKLIFKMMFKEKLFKASYSPKYVNVYK